MVHRTFGSERLPVDPSDPELLADLRRFSELGRRQRELRRQASSAARELPPLPASLSLAPASTRRLEAR